MSHVPHELHDEFPQDAALLHELKVSDAHFQKLSDRYHDVNREIHRIEAEVTPASDQALEALKKQRLGLLDEVAQALAKARATA
ncbi:MAG: DUF465 domain-containing protein [Sphingomonadales bacterium]|nr:DUF465 domain-containing protein [Sphingomonadales bacterium]